MVCVFCGAGSARDLHDDVGQALTALKIQLESLARTGTARVDECVDTVQHTLERVRQLSLSLRSVISQHLLPPAHEGAKRVLALEVMHVNQPVRVAIKFGKIESIESAIQTGKRDGMTSFDEELLRLAGEGRISMETARRYAKDAENMGVGGGRR